MGYCTFSPHVQIREPALRKLLVEALPNIRPSTRALGEPPELGRRVCPPYMPLGSLSTICITLRFPSSFLPPHPPFSLFLCLSTHTLSTAFYLSPSPFCPPPGTNPAQPIPGKVVEQYLEKGIRCPGGDFSLQNTQMVNPWAILGFPFFPSPSLSPLCYHS